MNKTKLKSYAPQARKDFIAAVTARANLLGLSEKGGKLEIAPSQTQGDVTVIAGQAWPVKVHAQRDQLIERIQKDGFAQTMEAIAYTWFNRFAALRYMELHDYLGHGHRALSSSAGGLPDILTHATDLANSDAANALRGLNAAKVTELQLAGNRDGELYRMLLVAQCNALSRAMPFLFERIDDDSELLLPDNLLRSDSVIAKLVEEIPEEDWAEVEIIGWLYQFYISEKKDQVIGKVVKSEDIPAATQLFTPNWIVQYLVQNSVGRLWLMANPQSTLAQAWPYYITPAEQTPQVQAQLDALIQTRVREDDDTLNPETITVLDPACGSGHILVVAYDVLKAIYLERGYQPRAIPRLILEKNLYGLDIDDRAAQMAGFALLMKARADDRRLFTATDDAGNLQPPKLNVLSLQESKGLSVDELATHLAPFKVQRATITALVETFEHAKTFGSLIQIPYALKKHLAVLPEVLALVKQSGDMYANAASDDLLPLVQQAQVLARQFDAVVANPPYMGGRGLPRSVTDFMSAEFPSSKLDLYSVFMERGFQLCKATGINSMVTMQGWMFLSSFATFREKLLDERSITSLIQIGYNSFPEMNSKVAQACAFSFLASKVDGLLGRYVDLNSAPQSSDKSEILLNRDSEIVYDVFPDDFRKMPGSPLSYTIAPGLLKAFSFTKLGELTKGEGKNVTADNERFLRLVWEVSAETVGKGRKWIIYAKGGDYRRWAGNLDYVCNWSEAARKHYRFNNSSRIISEEFWYLPGLTWTVIATSGVGFRYLPCDTTFDTKGLALFFERDENIVSMLALLNSTVGQKLISLVNQTMSINTIDIKSIPVCPSFPEISSEATELINSALEDWNSEERSFDFSMPQLLRHGEQEKSLSSAFAAHFKAIASSISRTRQLEETINSTLIEAYGLRGELSPEVPESQITLARADREKDCQRLISYAIGCMMGRYSLGAPGLIYAHAGNIGFDASRYGTFPADADGIVPLTDELWFEDDAASRIREFLLAVWGPDTLEENMAWLAESLGSKASETTDETIRRYLADKFYKDHLQTYKKRPIYWLFSSGKQGAFQALVYLHRYHEGTLARLRAEHVVPLTGKIQSRIDMLQKDATTASSTAARNKLAKEVDKLKKKHVELLAYDEQLRHHADMRITLDLDDGVKVNYGKFGNLLAEVKAVTGGAGDD
ncbi:BREX-1 system adenine-specific DNA-methyltransferase PglX [Polaromonas sp. JS666]|uniref:BREX-1 system adenine-specific DNA-methyltransferase PglX n=1 Tax=Polaromonas sp. (strain JS666 / ATCC BAA-500) TaxID=296591 RepID=UPI00004643BF|nr:BREX-1 system adenine-specific DNA-methyltransferase PglX [Polaromonas sp. JS666]ABE46899.1 type II restriction enzyme [Polaromonas sp. JS666]